MKGVPEVLDKMIDAYDIDYDMQQKACQSRNDIE